MMLKRSTYPKAAEEEQIDIEMASLDQTTTTTNTTSSTVDSIGQHIREVNHALSAELGATTDQDHSDFFELLQWEQRIYQDVSRRGTCRRICLCLEQLLSRTRHFYVSTVSCVCACIAQFFITGKSGSPEKGLWQSILIGLLLSVILTTLNMLITRFASVTEPLSGHKIYLAFSSYGRLNTMIALLLMSMSIGLIASVETQCTQKENAPLPPCSLKQIFTAGVFT
jgi:hypothetical protein